METRPEHPELLDDRSRSGKQPRTPSPGIPSATSSRWPGYHPCGILEDEHHPDRSPSREFETESMEQISVDEQASVDGQVPLDGHTPLDGQAPLEAGQAPLEGQTPLEDGQARPNEQATIDENTSLDARLLWQPRYLRRSVIATFVFIFATLIAAIEALVIISAKNEGIATSRSGLHYLWTYGPTAFLTLVAAFWSRVEYQSKLVAPWRRLMQQHPVDARQTLLLDYISDLQPLAIVKAFRNRDWTVSITCTVSILIRVLIVISTGLITLSWTEVHLNSYPMKIHDAFSDSSAQQLSERKTLSYYIMQGLIDQNLNYPNGISKDYAFQSTTANITDSAETQVTVDGLTNGLDCVPVDLGIRRENNIQGGVDITLTSSGCNVFAQNLETPGWAKSGDAITNGLIARFAQVQCDETKNDTGIKALVMFGNVTFGVDYSQNYTLVERYHGPVIHPIWAKLHRSTQMLCTPTYTIRRVDIVRNGTHSPRVIPVVGSLERSLGSIHAGAIMDTQFKAWDGAGPILLRRRHDKLHNWTAQMDIDEYMGLAMDSQLGLDTSVSPTDLFNPDFLRQLTEASYRQHTAIISKQVLMEPASIETAGSSIIMENRLVVGNWAQLMVGLTISCLILSVIALFTVSDLSIPRDPSCIPDVAALLVHSHDLQTKLSELCAADEKDLIRGLARCKFQLGSVRNIVTNQADVVILDQQQRRGNTPQHFTQTQLRSHPHPWILHPGLRLTLCSVLVALIIGLDLLLQKSNREDGLRDVENDDKYIHYLWTTTPALILGTITMVVSSMDFQIRSLAPYIMLKKKISSGRIFQLDHLVSTGEIGVKIQPREAAYTIIRYQDLQHFLETNFSYPRFTNNNLAFPQLLTGTTMASNSTFNLSSVSIEAVIPAIRGKVNCRLYNSSQHHLGFAFNDTTRRGGVFTHLNVQIEGERCTSNPQSYRPWYNQDFKIFPNTSYIARADEMSGDENGCSDLVYTWGKFNYSGQPIVQHIASAGCNVSFEGLDVDVSLMGTGLDFDTSPQNAPRPREDTVHDIPLGRARYRPATIQIKGYEDLAAIQAGQDLDDFFGILVSSRYAIPLSDLGDEAANSKVVDAIRDQHGIIQAQYLAHNRANASDSNATTLTTNSSSRIGLDNEGYTLYNATAIDTSGQRRRVKQDAASTRALQGLLGASLLLLIISWLFTYRETNVLPRPPTSIASVAALIAAGNLLRKLPLDAQHLDREAFAAALGVGSGGEKTTKYWIGWRTVPDLESGGKTRRFGIFAVEEGDDDEDEELTEGSEGEGDSGDEEEEVAGRRSTASVDDSSQ
ncbi:hypothetical protein PG984_002520 [Apiospora sp. TS-2023a]